MTSKITGNWLQAKFERLKLICNFTLWFWGNHFFLDFCQESLFDWLKKKKKKKMFPKAQGDVLKCLVLFTTQRYSDYCRRWMKKPENIHIQRIFTLLFLKETYQAHFRVLHFIKGYHKNTFTILSAQKAHHFSQTVQCCNPVLPLCLFLLLSL